MNKEKIKKKLIEKWEKIENDVDLVNMIDDIIEDTAKVILEEVEKLDLDKERGNTMILDREKYEKFKKQFEVK